MRVNDLTLLVFAISGLAGVLLEIMRWTLANNKKNHDAYAQINEKLLHLARQLSEVEDELAGALRRVADLQNAILHKERVLKRVLVERDEARAIATYYYKLYKKDHPTHRFKRGKT